MTQLDFLVILPVTFLALWASLLLLADVLFLKGQKAILALLAAVGLAVTLGLTLTQSGAHSASAFGGMVVLDGFSNFLAALFSLIGLLGVAVAYGYNRRMGIERGEYYALILFSVSGMMLMAQATDLLMVFLALELLSIPLYVLAAFAYPRASSEEAGLKYFLLGAFATGFVVYGIALTFGATGVTSIPAIAAAVQAGTADTFLLLAGAALILAGFGFKVATVPFHMWTPDVYQGAPTSVTAFMAAGAKAAGFAALLRVFAVAFPSLAADVAPVLWALSALSMLAGNVAAIAQTDVKRMLAYSSIAQAGYILMAFVPFANEAIRPSSVAAALFYLVAYTFTSFGAWGVIMSLEKDSGESAAIADFAGLGKHNPALAVAMTVFMLSLTGLPPTLGLVGKMYLFRVVVEGGFYWLAVIGVVTSLISAFYYLRVVQTMWMKDGKPQVAKEDWLNFAIAFSALATVVLSFVPASLFDWASQAVFFTAR
jgi:NADH-quinone oxidoreductase subunit N